ncbi:MAG TPA: glycoside hydrolase family 3 N-terminal domain-containing protein, partial [Fimbriimonadaceae bacterium]|nr:glycoside hydrolase family 3 N-terminal domain-containing protein [Fimbriimonadaceae bacterium]
MRRNAFLAGVFTSAAMAVIALSGAQTYRYPFQNPGLSLEQRVEDLVTRLSPDEKIAQLQHNSPAVSRLGIPAHFWKHDPAKGSARAGTVFPQPIGLAASFNPELAMEVAGALSDELRAKNNDAVRRGVRDAQTNLTLWLPEPNVLRDPRWGGGQNSFGEDPFLASRFAVAYAKGIQGTDPDFLKVLAAPRGFAPFSGPGSGVARFNAGVSRHDLHSSYLPAFEALVREARPWAVVSAPNRVNGLAAAATPYLLEDMLRERWGFRGVVISDCGGQGRSPEEIAKAVRAGTDLDCAVCNRALVEARKKGLVTEEQIEASLRRAFAARFKLGQFDPGGSVIHSKIALSVVDSPRHRRLALEAARQSIVLL